MANIVTTNLKDFLEEVAEAIRIRREEYNELYSPQVFAEKILDIPNTNNEIPVGVINFFDGDNGDSLTPNILGLMNSGGNLIAIDYYPFTGSGDYTGYTLPDMVHNSILLVQDNPSFIEINGPSKVILKTSSYFVIQVYQGRSDIFLYYHSTEE